MASWPPFRRGAASAACALASGGASDGSCPLPPAARLSLPAALAPLLAPSSSSPGAASAFAATPLLLLALSLLFLSLLASHVLSRTPLDRLGGLGRRGRRHFAWNESIAGGCGRGFLDWWAFGGTVWLRAGLCLWDAFFGNCCVEVDDNESELWGENMFVCIATSHKDALPEGALAEVEGKADAKGKKAEKDENGETDGVENGKVGEGDRKDEGQNPPQMPFGILGYDSSLGAHGPLVLAPLRASVMLLAWCSVCSFLIMTHRELSGWMGSMEEMRAIPSPATESSPYLEILESAAFYVLQGIQSVMSMGNTGGIVLEDAEGTDFQLGVLLPTVLYASGFVAAVETCLFVLAQARLVLNLLPLGVSHPGGPRPGKIVRFPEWTKGKQHFLSKELLQGGEGDLNHSKWRCAVAHDAHRDTLAKFDDADSPSKFSGEPFGRQIWTTSVARPPSGEGETEDDLEAKMRKEFPPAKQENGTKESPRSKGGNNDKKGDRNIFSPLADIFNPDSPQSKKKQDPVGDFVQNLFGPNAKGREVEKHQRGRERNMLVQALASGGRSPPLVFDPSKNPNSCDQLFRAQMIASYLDKNNGKLPEDISHLQRQATEEGKSTRPKTPMEAAKRGIAFYSLLQTPDGHFAGDYGGPHFLLPGLIVAWYVMGQPSLMISHPQKALMMHYLKAHQQKDGGWGSHIESPSTMFGTTLCYLAARLLGASGDAQWMKRGRKFIKKEGGAVMTSSWAKFWLCLLGCMDWKGASALRGLFCFLLTTREELAMLHSHSGSCLLFTLSL